MPDLSNWRRAYILYYFDEKATRFFTGLAKGNNNNNNKQMYSAVRS